MANEPLNPSVTPLYQPRYAENTSGIIAAITACIQAAGGLVTSYPSNTGGVIQALIDLQLAISGGGAGAQSKSVLVPAVSGEPLSLGDAVYIKTSDGRVYKAYNNNSREKANVIGLAKEAVSNAGDQVTVVARGPITGLTGLTVGLDYFLDSNGAISTTAPSGGGVYSVHIGQAISSTQLDVQPNPPVSTT
ncbi:MAG TPA: hypothetical protein DEP13_04810 [Gammaproteobacteria bacterium]|nr:MAG: hypothetical protein CBD74_05910 [Saprospirales bacterium TMED214]HCA35946.1 hypothetical protein [Gammaproteobacteria bacterium]